MPRQIFCQPKLAVLQTALFRFVVMLWFGLALYSYRHVIGELFHQWQTNTGYSHGPIVLPIALWIFWSRRSTFPEVEKPWIAGAGLLLAAHLLLFVGEYFYLPAVQRWTLPLWLIGMTALMWGRAVVAWSLPGIGFLVFMIPLPFQLEMLANQFLQWASAWCACVILSLTSIFAVTDGYTLRMATGRVGITADCSGLRMTVAIAALCYVITFLHNGRSLSVRRGGASSLGLAWHLSLMMLLVIPAAVLANAARIMVMAFVMDRFRADAYTDWAHDFGDWLILPVSAVLFLAFRAWLGNAIHIGWTRIRLRRQSLLRRQSPLRRPSRNSVNTPRQWILTYTPVIGMASVPVVLGILTFASIRHYESQREGFATEIMKAARSYETNGDWERAAKCYRELIVLQSSPVEARYRHAWVSRQAATSRAEKEKALLQFESILRRTPYHRASLQSHLDLALELGRAPEAIRSAERLYWIDRPDVTTRQMCGEVMMRYPKASLVLPSISVESLSGLVQKFGPVPQWRDSLVIEVAKYCCSHRDSVDSQLTSAIGAAISKATDHLGSAKAHFESWHFEHVFGEGDASLEAVRMHIDDECPNNVIYEIYLASAQEVWRGGKPDDTKSFLKKAIALNQTDHRSYELLGDVYQAQQESSKCTAAYLRAWRLAGNHPLELGIKLAESFSHGERDFALAPLVETLEHEVQKSAITSNRELRIRLRLVQSRLAMRQARFEDALMKLEQCRMLATWNLANSDAPDVWVPVIETLQAQCLVRLGRYADTARLFENRARKLDSPANQWTAAARAWRTAGNAFAAEHCYRNAVFKQGVYSEIWLEYLSLLRGTHGIDKAVGEVAFRHRYAQHGLPIADEVLAQAWEMVGRPELAIEHYRLAAKREAKDTAALAIALARQGQIDDALGLIADESWSVSKPIRAHTAAVVGANASNLSSASKASITQIVQDGISAVDDDAILLMAAVQWYTQCQSTYEAMKLLQRVVTLQPGNVVAANNLAMMLADEGCEFERAMECIDNVLNQTGPISEFLDTKGWILVQMNRAEEAIPWLIQAVEKSLSQDPITQLHLATAYMDHGDRVHAREYLEAARAAPILPELLNNSEQLAWKTLQKEFTQVASTGADGVAW